MTILDFIKKVQEMHPATYTEDAKGGMTKECNVEMDINFDERRKRFRISCFINKERWGFCVEDREDKELQLETNLDEAIKKLESHCPCECHLPDETRSVFPKGKPFCDVCWNDKHRFYE